MFKKTIILFIYLNYFINKVFAAWPHIKSYWLPWNTTGSSRFFKSLIEEFIQISLGIAVFSLIISWIYLIISAWEEEKFGKAKKWITWSLVWVFLASIAWWIVNWLNNIQISF